MRAIYAPILTHIYDTSTDIGVLVLWGQLAFNEDTNDIKHVDMMLLFVLSCVFLGLYRFFGIFMSGTTDSGNGVVSSILLGLTDTGIFVEVYQAFKQQKEEKPPEIYGFQLFEAVIESIPQMVLQIFFFIRTFRSDAVLPLDSVLLSLSIFGLFLSISSKVIEFDTGDSNANAAPMNFTCSKQKRNERGQLCCVEVGYIVRCLFRFSQVCVTICVYSMIWAIMGGWWLGAYLVYIPICVLCVNFCVYKESNSSLIVNVMAGFIYFIEDTMNVSRIARVIEQFILMIVII